MRVSLCFVSTVAVLATLKIIVGTISNKVKSMENTMITPKLRKLNPNYGPWMLVIRKQSLAHNGRGSMEIKGVSGLEGHKGKAKIQAVDVDVRTKSTFGILEANVSDPTHEDGITEALGEGVFYAEHDTLSPQACQEDFLAVTHDKRPEASIKKVSQNSIPRPSKSLWIKTPKILKCQVASPGNRSLNIQASSTSAIAQADFNGNKFLRFNAFSLVKMGNLA